MWGWGKIEIWQKIIQYWNECVGANACEFVSLYDIYIMHLCVCVCVCVSFFAENLKSNIYLMHKQMKHALRFVCGDMKNASSFLHKWKWTCNWITRVQRGWKGKYTCMHVTGFEFRAVVEFGFWGHKTRHRRSRLAFGILNKHILGTNKKKWELKQFAQKTYCSLQHKNAFDGF